LIHSTFAAVARFTFVASCVAAPLAGCAVHEDVGRPPPPYVEHREDHPQEHSGDRPGDRPADHPSDHPEQQHSEEHPR
jgi:hypothetical protein